MDENEILLASRELPHSIEAEQSVLGAIISQPSVLSDVIELIKPEYFYNDQQAETRISENATYTFTVNRELYVFAKFAEKEMYNFIAYSAPYNGGNITENGKSVQFGNGRMVEKGTQITLRAEANEGFTFVGWYKSVDDQNEELISADATYTFTVNERTYVYAKFVENSGN